MKAGGSNTNLDWHAVALMIGERIADDGPNGYYDFKPYQWLEWADAELRDIKEESESRRLHILAMYSNKRKP